MHKWLFVSILFFYACEDCSFNNENNFYQVQLEEYETHFQYKTANPDDFYTSIQYLNLNKTKKIYTKWPGTANLIDKPHVIILPYKKEPQTMVLTSVNRTDTLVVTTLYEVISECEKLIYRRKSVNIDYNTNPAMEWNNSYFRINN